MTRCVYLYADATMVVAMLAALKDEAHKPDLADEKHRYRFIACLPTCPALEAWFTRAAENVVIGCDDPEVIATEAGWAAFAAGYNGYLTVNGGTLSRLDPAGWQTWHDSPVPPLYFVHQRVHLRDDFAQNGNLMESPDFCAHLAQFVAIGWRVARDLVAAAKAA